MPQRSFCSLNNALLEELACETRETGHLWFNARLSAQDEVDGAKICRRASKMEKFTSLMGVAAPLEITNVDTDMIIPKQYLKTVKRTGLGKGLFAEQRYKDDGSENPDFILNKPAYRNARVLGAGANL